MPEQARVLRPAVYRMGLAVVLYAAAFLGISLISMIVVLAGVRLDDGQQVPVSALLEAMVPAWIVLAVSAPFVIWALKRALWRVQALENLHALVVRHSADAVFLTSPDGRIFNANPAACTMFGYSEEEFIAGGRALIADMHDPEVRRLIEHRRALGVARGEAWVRRKDGQNLRVEVTSALFEVAGQERTAIVMRDVSRYPGRDYQDRLMRTAFADVGIVICVIDASWRMLWVNEATTEISGYTRDELIGRPAPLYRRLAEEAPAQLDEINTALRETGRWSGEVFTRRRSGELYPLYGTMTRIESSDPEAHHYVATFADVSVLREYEHKIRKISRYDHLTGLPNRDSFEGRVQQALGIADPGTARLALMLVNLDSFKAVNESLGHRAGDRVLKAAADRLRGLGGAGATVARYASDTFALLVRDMSRYDDVGVVAGEIISAFRDPLETGQERLSLTVGIGISLFPADGETASRLLQSAETALDHIKREGGDGFRFYEHGSEIAARRFVSLATELRESLARDEIIAHFQPIVDSSNHRVIGMEALARWPRANGTVTGPMEFIPVAERSGLIVELGESLLRQACMHLRTLDAAGFTGLTTSVNLSARQFRDQQLAAHLLSIIEEQGVEPARITLEITESLMMDDPDAKQEMLEAFQSHGLNVVVDDFGTGYSSLAYLKNFNLDGIKVDRAFVRPLPGDERDIVILRTILAVARELRLPVVAEGVETEAQAEILRARGCQRLQGYLFARPMSSSDFVAFMRARTIA